MRRLALAALAVASCSANPEIETSEQVSTTSAVATTTTTTTTTTITTTTTTTTTTTVPEPVVVPKPGQVLKCEQWHPLAASVGITDIATLDRIMWRESRCLPDAFNPDDPMGGSMGLTQINSFWLTFLCEAGIACERDQLFDPVVSLTATLAIWQYGEDRYGLGSGWGPWNL